MQAYLPLSRRCLVAASTEDLQTGRLTVAEPTRGVQRINQNELPKRVHHSYSVCNVRDEPR